MKAKAFHEGTAQARRAPYVHITDAPAGLHRAAYHFLATRKITGSEWERGRPCRSVASPDTAWARVGLRLCEPRSKTPFCARGAGKHRGAKAACLRFLIPLRIPQTSLTPRTSHWGSGHVCCLVVPADTFRERQRRCLRQGPAQGAQQQKLHRSSGGSPHHELVRSKAFAIEEPFQILSSVHAYLLGGSLGGRSPLLPASPSGGASCEVQQMGRFSEW